MLSLKTLTQQIVEMSELQGLVEVYEELAATKMQEIKSDIVSARRFYDELCQISLEVGSDIDALLPNQVKKTAAVFVAANSGLFGDIIHKTFQIFCQFIKTNKADVFVVGKLGEQLMKTFADNISYQKLNFPDDQFIDSDFQAITKTVSSYQRIVIFHGQFKSIAVQLPQIAELPGHLLPKNLASLKNIKKIRFSNLYEPSLFHVSALFEQEILTTSLGQVLSESQLAKLGSRLISLDQTIDRINEQEDLLNRDKYRLRKKAMGKKQNAMIYSLRCTST